MRGGLAVDVYLGSVAAGQAAAAQALCGLNEGRADPVEAATPALRTGDDRPAGRLGRGDLFETVRVGKASDGPEMLGEHWAEHILSEAGEAKRCLEGGSLGCEPEGTALGSSDEGVRVLRTAADLGDDLVGRTSGEKEVAVLAQVLVEIAEDLRDGAQLRPWQGVRGGVWDGGEPTRPPGACESGDEQGEGRERADGKAHLDLLEEE